MAETVLVMIVLLFFLLLSPALWRMWITDQYARTEAHRDLFVRASTFVDLPSPPHWPWDPWPEPEAADIPSLNPTPPGNLRKYRKFPNKTNEGRHTETVRYSAGWKDFRGEFEIERRCYAIRSSWTWAGFPFVHTQDLVEYRKIRSWYRQAYKTPLSDRTVKALKLDKSPL
jgi:hypothetical protein